MGKYSVEISKSAKKDLEKLHKSGKKIDIAKVSQIIKELGSNPREGIGQPERLKYFAEEIWSRAINKKDRITYEIRDSEVIVIILSALGHYNDK